MNRIAPTISGLLRKVEQIDKYTAAERADCCDRAAQRTLERLRAAGFAHVTGWRKDRAGRGNYVALYSDGAWTDAERPAPSGRKRSGRPLSEGDAAAILPIPAPRYGFWGL